MTCSLISVDFYAGYSNILSNNNIKVLMVLYFLFDREYTYKFVSISEFEIQLDLSRPESIIIVD